jgi:hypothetical protein
MSQKQKASSRSRSLLLTLFLGAGVFSAFTSWELGVSLVGSVLILVAFVETGMILAGLATFQSRQGLETTGEE